MGENKLEFIGAIIDVFEDFLEEKGITLDNPEICEAVEYGDDPETLAIIYGSDYDLISGQIERILDAWKISSHSASPEGA